MDFGISYKKHKKERKEVLYSVFRFKDVKACTGGFSDESLIGKSILGSLYKAILEDGNPVVVKRGIGGPRQYTGHVAQTNELRILTRLHSDNNKHFVKLIGFSDDEKETLLMLEYPTRGTLHDVLHGGDDPSSPPLCLPLRIHLAFQVAKCMKVLHFRHGLVHRDLRSSHVWIDRNWKVRVANFSLAMDIPWEGSMPESPIGTLGMLDPDYPKKGYLAAKVDVFSFGILMLEIISSRKVFRVQNSPGDIIDWGLPLVRKNQILAIGDPKVRLSPREAKIPRDMARIAAMCLQPTCCMRPTMSDVVERLRLLSSEFPFKR